MEDLKKQVKLMKYKFPLKIFTSQAYLLGPGQFVGLEEWFTHDHNKKIKR